MQTEVRENIPPVSPGDTTAIIRAWLESRDVDADTLAWRTIDEFTGFGVSTYWEMDGVGEVHGVLTMATPDCPAVALYDKLPQVVHIRPANWPSRLIGRVRYELRDATVCPYTNGITRIDVWYVWSVG
jgi:hypothetical protein